MKITNNFSKKEFDSRDGSEMPQEVLSNIKEVARNLEVLRALVSAPIKINSGYRSPAHNKAIGGVKNSFHVKGMAADIKVEGYSSKHIYGLIEVLIERGDMKEGGLGLYNGFVHYDVRGTKARWDYRKK